VERLARATGFTAAEVRRTIAMYTQGRTLGLLGEARVNVLEVNLALEGLLPNGRGVSGASTAAPR
jgi:K+-transporting ATPase, c chain